MGLIAWLDQTRVALPLKGVECRFHINGGVVCVEMAQIFFQSATQPLDCTYIFPLPAGAAVHRCELHGNGRVIRARAEGKAEAERMYRTQIASGKRAALVEQERENLFRLSLGNLQPGDLVVVRFAWFQVLDRNAAQLSLRIPTCPGVRYIPGDPLLRTPSGKGTIDDTDQVPDASRITPPRIDALHPDAAYLSVCGELAVEDVEPGTASSASHPVAIRTSEGRVKVELFGRDDLPDRDFLFVWNEPVTKTFTPQGWHWQENGTTYALLQLRAPHSAAIADDFSQDFHFLVDRSSSMEGKKWKQTCLALHALAELLGVEDRVSITVFDSSYRDFSDAPMAAPRVLEDRGFQLRRDLGPMAPQSFFRPSTMHSRGLPRTRATAVPM